MQLGELMTSLSLGLLRNLSVGGSGSGTIPGQSQALVIDAINKGLVALFTRFSLIEKEVIIRAYDNQTLYPLKRRYADQDPTVVTQKFIADTADEPFHEDIVKILGIFDEEGSEMLLDDPDPSCIMFRPKPTTLQITQPVTGNSYSVIYQGYHPKILNNPLTQEIEIPPIMQEALECYVAYRIMNPMNGQEHSAKALEHFQRYELLCQEIIENDTLGLSLAADSDKLKDRGFV